MMSPEEVKNKVGTYEYFLEDTLKRDLNEIQNILKNKVAEHKDWEEVKNVVKTVNEFKEKNRDMPIQVEVGEGLRVQGEINDYERSFVNIGLDYLLEMDCEEAEKYADIRLNALKRDIDHYRNLAVQIKVNIKMVLLAINELQSISGIIN